jgi:hypothetical protein
MFRKLYHILIATLLFTTTTGFSISKHYCGSRLVSISIDHEEKSCCDMDGCCHNDTKVFQLNEKVVISPILENNYINSMDLLFPLFYLIRENVLFEDINKSFQISESPPLVKRQTVLSLLQTYLC